MVTRAYVAYWCSLIISLMYAVHQNSTFAIIWFIVAVINFIIDLIEKE